jgi:imidazoleglycerol-phosphate dehydratase
MLEPWKKDSSRSIISCLSNRCGGNKMSRVSSVKRQTNETNIELTFNIDGEGQSNITTGVPFLNHMLDLFAKHGQFDLIVQASGDTDVDDHHTTEDIGICLGQVLREALGDKKGIKRYGNAFVPMDETLAQVVVDLSNRPHLEMRAHFPSQKVGTFDTELVHEFMWKLALEARINLHIIVHYGQNTHHIIEAIFKALSRALDEATTIDPRIKGVPSTKGML